MNIKSLFAAALVAAVPGVASAATITPVAANCAVPALPNVITFVTPSACGTEPARRNINNIEFASAGDGDFFSLGIGGAAIFEVNPAIASGPGHVFEVTNPGTNHRESMAIYVSNVLDFGSLAAWDLVGGVTNINGGVPVSGSKSFNVTGVGPWKYILFVDNSKSVFPTSGTTDGFDIDAFKVSVVPVPAAGFLLLAGLGGLAAMRRRKAS
jgi:hypothetical protein